MDSRRHLSACRISMSASLESFLIDGSRTASPETFLLTSFRKTSPISLIRMYTSHKFAKCPIVIFQARQNEIQSVAELGVDPAIQIRRCRCRANDGHPTTPTVLTTFWQPQAESRKTKRKLSDEELVHRRAIVMRLPIASIIAPIGLNKGCEELFPPLVSPGSYRSRSFEMRPRIPRATSTSMAPAAPWQTKVFPTGRAAEFQQSPQILHFSPKI